MNIDGSIARACNRIDLTEGEAYQAGVAIFSGSTPLAEIKELLQALQSKGETVDEVLGFMRAAREFSEQKPMLSFTSEPVLDVCGTGGGGLRTFNVSTAAAIVVAACGGVRVAKHCGLGITNPTGSADVLKYMGIRMCYRDNDIENALAQFRLSFISARDVCPGLKSIFLARKQISGPTIMNIIAPLLNPAPITHRVIGVSTLAHLDLVSKVLCNIEGGVTQAFVVMGDLGEDEVSVLGGTHFCRVRRNSSGPRYSVDRSYVELKEFGIRERTKAREIAGGSSHIECAGDIGDLLNGRLNGAKRRMLLVNASAALVAIGEVSDFSSGVKRAGWAISSGRAGSLLEQIKTFVPLA